MNYFWISLLHIVVSCLVFYTCFTLINLLKVEEEKWTSGKEILSLSLVLLVMGLGNFLIRDLLYDNPNNWSFLYLLEEIKNTFLVGLLIVFILVPLNFARIYGRNFRKAESFQAPDPNIIYQRAEQVLIETQLKSDDFSLQLENFLFAKAEGNYVEIHLNPGSQNIKLLKRITIKEFEKQLEDFPWIFKTHRSYLVNLNKITAVSGNAQGYQLSLQQESVTVPVSRGMIKKFDEAFTRPAL